MAAWDKDLDQPAPAWEKDLDEVAPKKEKKAAPLDTRPELQQRMTNMALGAVRGAGSIGATILAPQDALNAFLLKSKAPDRRAAMDNALSSMGADTDSLSFGAGKLATEIAGTAGIAPSAGGGIFARAGKGALAGGAAAGLIDPNAAVAGGAIGGGLPFAGALVPSRLIGKGVSYVQNALEPYLPGGLSQIKGRVLNALAGDRAPQVIGALDNPRSFVPGSYPNAGEAATTAGAAPFAAAQELVKKKLPSEYLARERAQEAARKTALKTIGPSIGAGDDKLVLKAAETIREDAAKQNYGKAFTQLVQDDPVFGDLMSRPSMQAAFARAKLLAKEKEQTFVLGESVPSKVVPGKLVRDEMGVPRMSEEVVPGEVASFPVSSLHKIKKALDDVIKTPERFIGIGDSERAAALSTRAEFLKWLDGKSKAYEFAKSEHARLSDPINRMEVGGYLENKLASPMGISERPAAFAQAMKDAPKTIQSATGMVRKNDLSQVLAPHELSRVENVLSDLTRQGEYDRLAKAGTEKARKLLGDAVKSPEGLMAGYLSRPISIARNILARLHGGATEKTVEQLAKDMLDPKVVAELMRNAKPAERFELDRHLRKLHALKNPLVTAGALATTD